MTSERLHPLLSGALLLYVWLLPIEIPDRGGFPLEVHTVTGALLLLAALIQPGRAFARPPAALWWFAAYFYVFVCLGVVTEHVGQWLKDAFTFLQVLLLFWVTSTLLRDVALAIDGALVEVPDVVVVEGQRRVVRAARIGYSNCLCYAHDRSERSPSPASQSMRRGPFPFGLREPVLLPSRPRGSATSPSGRSARCGAAHGERRRRGKR